MQKDFSFPLKIDELNQGRQVYKLSADKEQRKILSEILQVPAVHCFESELELNFQKKKGLLEVSGYVKANLGLVSVISLEPFDKEYHTDFKLTFDTTSTYEQIREDDDTYDDTLPDVVIGGKIDLGDIAIEQLALMLEDHPRQENEEFTPIIEDTAPVRNNPFAVLSKLKK